MCDGKTITVIRKLFDVCSKEYDEVSEYNSNGDHVETPSVKRQKLSSAKVRFA